METRGRAKRRDGTEPDMRAHKKPGRSAAVGSYLEPEWVQTTRILETYLSQASRPFFWEAANGERIFSFEGFFDVNVVRFFEFRGVAREISGSEQQRRREDGLGVRE
jgi:hypothetical protein